MPQLRRLTRLARLEEEFSDFKKAASLQTPLQPTLQPIPETPHQPLPAVPQLTATECLTHPPLSSLDLSSETLSEYCAIWFEHYHSWFPILHQPTVLDACQEYANQSVAPLSLVLKSIAVIVAPTQPLGPMMTEVKRREYLLALGDEILLAAMHNCSLQSLQALLILSIHELGSGRIVEFYNLIALSKR